MVAGRHHPAALLPGQRAARAARGVTVDAGGTPVRVLGTHLQWDREDRADLVQAEAIVATLDDRPTLLLGDLNTVPGSPTYRLLAGHLVDAWAAVGVGRGAHLRRRAAAATDRLRVGEPGSAPLSAPRWSSHRPPTTAPCGSSWRWASDERCLAAGDVHRGGRPGQRGGPPLVPPHAGPDVRDRRGEQVDEVVGRAVDAGQGDALHGIRHGVRRGLAPVGALADARGPRVPLRPGGRLGSGVEGLTRQRLERRVRRAASRPPCGR